MSMIAVMGQAFAAEAATPGRRIRNGQMQTRLRLPGAEAIYRQSRRTATCPRGVAALWR